MTQPTKAEFQKVSDLVASLDKRVELVQKDAELAGSVAAKSEQLGEKLREEVGELRRECAVLRQRIDDHLKRFEERDRRVWGLVILLLGAVLSLASGLIVTLARK